jgi:geranylgeranyl diphosphate synthase, type II
MRSISELQQIVQNAFRQISFPEQPELLYEPITYTLDLGGKRIRPLLVLIAAEMLDGDLNECLPAAVGIELFHNFTLLHDDIMDAAPLRRGKPTVFQKWNSNVAILSGDTLFAISYQYLLKTKPDKLLQVLELVNKTAVEVCEGQQFDMDFETQSDVSVQEYLEMIRLKTAVLLAASLKCGAMIAGADENLSQQFYNYGIKQGMAFQLRDDYLDTFGDVDTFGKATGGDIECSKKTYLYLKALELAGTERNSLKKLYESVSENKVENVTRIFRELNVDKYSQQLIENYAAEADAILCSIPLEKEKTDMLKNFADALLQRSI